MEYLHSSRTARAISPRIDTGDGHTRGYDESVVAPHAPDALFRHQVSVRCKTTEWGPRKVGEE